MSEPRQERTLMRCRELCAGFLSHDLRAYYGDRAHWYLRAVDCLIRAQRYFLQENWADGVPLLQELQSLREMRGGDEREDAELIAFLAALRQDVQHPDCAPRSDAPWAAVPAQATKTSVPTMLDEVTQSYYEWAARELSGAGDILELGCWLGGGTLRLCSGLAQNTQYENRRALHVVDAFLWCPWMSAYCDLRLDTGESFAAEFKRICRAYSDVIAVHVAVVGPEGGFGASSDWLKELDRPIELLVYDLAQDEETVQHAWDSVRPFLLRGRSRVVMSGFGNLRAEGMRRFCREHRAELRPLEKPHSAAKAFRFE